MKKPLLINTNKLSNNHLIIINLLKNFYKEFNLTPSTRALINYINTKNPELNLNSIIFHELFPDGIAQACLIAGLPKSPRCL